jgi:hypothetical protein
MAAATRSDHSRAATWVSGSLNLAAKAVANKKTPLFRDGAFKIKMLTNCSANYDG